MPFSTLKKKNTFGFLLILTFKFWKIKPRISRKFILKRPTITFGGKSFVMLRTIHKPTGLFLASSFTCCKEIQAKINPLNYVISKDPYHDWNKTCSQFDFLSLLQIHFTSRFRSFLSY